jgi:hypothetical protein
VVFDNPLTFFRQSARWQEWPGAGTSASETPFSRSSHTSAKKVKASKGR